MPQSRDPRAYPSERAVLERALDAPRGIRIAYGSPGAAWNAMQRFRAVRSNDRRESMKIFPLDHPMFGRSIFETLAIYQADADGTNAGTGKKATSNEAAVWVYIIPVQPGDAPHSGVALEEL